MWHTQFENLGRQSLRLRLLSAQQVLTFARVVELWRCNALFREWFNGILADVPFAAYVWEAIPTSPRAAGREFECVLISSDALADIDPDPASFETQFASMPASETVVTFPNLGGDAMLVVPRPAVSGSVYGHLAAFARRAPAEQIQALWQAVGDALAERKYLQPVWLSTAGLGVPWLHVRLDSRPKYYRFGPYRTAPP